MKKNFIIFIAITILLFISTGCEEKVQTQAEIKTPTETKIEAKVEEQEELIATGEFSDGAKIYRDKIQKECNMMSGYSLARKKSKEQWEEIAQQGKLADTIQEICPKVTFNNIWTPDIYEYLYKNAISAVLLHTK